MFVGLVKEKVDDKKTVCMTKKTVCKAKIEIVPMLVQNWCKLGASGGPVMR